MSAKVPSMMAMPSSEHSMVIVKACYLMVMLAAYLMADVSVDQPLLAGTSTVVV